MQEDLHRIRVPWILESIPDGVRVVRVRRVGGQGLLVVQGGRPVIRLERDRIAPTRASVGRLGDEDGAVGEAGGGDPAVGGETDVVEVAVRGEGEPRIRSS